MPDQDGGETPPADLPETLLQRVDALSLSELKSLHSYVESCLEAPRSSLDAEIEANAAGEVVSVETHGGHAHVKMHPLDSAGEGVDESITSLYHVQNETRADGEKSLHWVYLGDVYHDTESRCVSCGQTFDREVDVCPDCGSDDVDRTETED